MFVLTMNYNLFLESFNTIVNSGKACDKIFEDLTVERKPSPPPPQPVSHEEEELLPPHHDGAPPWGEGEGAGGWVGNKEVGVGRAQLAIVGRVIVGRAVMAMIGGKETTAAHNHTGMMRMHSRNGPLKGRTTANSRRLMNAEGVGLIHGGDGIATDAVRGSGAGLKKIWKILRLVGQKNIQGFR